MFFNIGAKALASLGLSRLVSARTAGDSKPAPAGLPPVEAPRGLKRGGLATPSHIKRASNAGKRGDDKIAEEDRRTAQLDVLSQRIQPTTKDTIRVLGTVSPDMSASVYAYIRLAVTRNFTAVAYHQDGTINTEATVATQALLNRLNYLQDYTDGFAGVSSIHAIAESLVKECRFYGSMALELVLDKTLMPNRLQPISTSPSQLSFARDKSNYVYPVQKVGDKEVNLDVPTFFYEALDQDLLTAYSNSPMEAALSATMADAEFNNDVRRVIKRALHPRLDVTVDLAEYIKNLPLEIRNDPEKLAEHTSGYIAGVQQNMNDLEPQDALVHDQGIKVDYLNNGNTSLDREYETIQGINNSKLATGTKAPPAVLGHGSGSQNVASTETMLFIRYCEGVQLKLNSIFSRALTLGLRLMGHDVFVRFEFERIDMRPDSELEAFRQMKQERILRQLSLGLLTDEEASLALTGKLPPPGSPKLSGTMFHTNQTVNSNPYSNTSQGALGEDLAPATPTQPKGPAKRSTT